MPSLTKNKEVFNSVANADVVSSNAPNGDVGVSKSIGEEGFFIKSEVTFTLWTKNGAGVWSISNNNAATGVYPWGANQSFFIQSDSDTPFYVFKRLQTPVAKAVVKRGDKTNRAGTFDTPTDHSNIASSWTTSGHTGEPYSIGLFGLNGAGDYLSAPPSGQREGKILGWDENGDLGWIPAPVDEWTHVSGIEDTATLFDGAVLTDGALVLDGSNYALSNSNYHFGDQFQASVWFKQTAFDAGYQILMSTRQWNGSANGFTVAVVGNKIHTHHNQTDNQSFNPDIPANINLHDGEWHQVQVRWIANTEWSVFLDGVKLGTAVPSGGINAGVASLNIGRDPLSGGAKFVGQIDGVSVTNQIKTDLGVANDYSGFPGITLLGSNPMMATSLPISDPGATSLDTQDGDLTAQITSDWDAVVGANPAIGTYTVTYSVTDSDGNVSNATREVGYGDGLEDLATLQNGASRVDGVLVLDGTNDYSYLDHSTDYDLDGGDMTVDFWFKTNSPTGAGRGLVTKGIGHPTWKGWGIYLHDANGIAFNFWSSDVGGGNRSNLFGTASDWNLGEWNHMAVVMSTANPYKAYVNGELLHEFTPNSKTTTTDSELKIGATQICNNNNLGHPFDGEIKKVNITKSAFSAGQVMATFLGGATIILAEGDATVGLSGMSDPGATAFDENGTDVTNQIVSDWDSVVGASPDLGVYTVTYSIASLGLSSTLQLTIGDGLEYLATLQNGASLVDGVLVLDGSNDYGFIPNSTDYDLDGGDMTVSCWFKTDAALAGGRGLLTKGIGNPTWKGWGLYLHDAGNSAFNFWSSNVGGGNRSNLFGTPSDWNLGEWNHIAVVMSTANPYKAYVNGQLLAEFTPNSKTTTTDSELKIGATQIHNNNNLGHPFGGEIKKANIVKSAKSAADILAEYNAG